jgi:hypothetical protein
MIETLGKDKTKKSVSSQPVIKSGPNKGFRQPEKDGCWIYMDGYNYDCLQSEKSVHYIWADHLHKIGFRIGTHDYEGVKSFYIFKSKNFAL